MLSLKRFIPATFVVLWATGFIGARYIMPLAEPFTFLSMRFVIAALLLLSIAILLGARPANRDEALHAVVAGMLLHGVYLGGVFWAVHRGLPAGLSALIAGLQPLLTAVIAGRLLGEKILPRHWIGLGVGFAGVIVVLWPKLGELGSGITTGTLTASLLSVLGITLGTIWQKRRAAGSSLLSTTVWQYVGGALVVMAGSFLFETQTITFNGELVFALVWLVLVLSIGAIFLLMVMIRDGEMSKVASVFYLVPGVTAIMAWALFGERLDPLQVAGQLIATFGVALATVQPATRARASR